MPSTLLLASLFVVGLLPSALAYTLNVTYAGTSFFDGWDFFTAPDPTRGFVKYVDAKTAWCTGLVSSSPEAARISADITNVTPNGRPSVRLTTKQTWDRGLFVINLQHMPVGCGTWPAWWMFGPDWPNSGEIDIIEGVNTNNEVLTALHSQNGCAMPIESSSEFTGRWSPRPDGGPANNCYINAPFQYFNQGCAITGDYGTYGQSLNDNGGGVFAMEWTDTFIRVFFFPQDGIPADLTSQQPQPSTWGQPIALYKLGSNCPSRFYRQMSMVINLTFCGDWAGAVFGSNCPGLGDCASFVRSNPQAFAEAYWLIKYIHVYQ